MDVNRAELLVKTTLIIEYMKDIVEVPIADPDPIKISLINNNNFFI